MDSTRNFLSSRTKIKVSIATFICLFAFGILLEAWREDVSMKSLGFGSNSSELENLDTQEDLNNNSSQVIEASATSTELAASQTSNVSTPAVVTEVISPQLPAIVAGAVKADDLAWMYDMNLDYDVFPFIVTEPNMPDHLAVPANKGREAMVYLSYLINEYDNLPPYAIFIHGHRYAWHQAKDMVDMIRRLQVDALEDTHYISFRCSWSPSCPAELRPIDHDAVIWGDGNHVRETEDAVGEAWSMLFPGEELPATISAPCCAQFAVTKAAMQRRSKDDYIRMRDWLLHTPLDNEVSGRVFEKLWAYIMLGEAVHCPAPQVCACKYFGSCGPHHWPLPPHELGPLPTDGGAYA